jgi:hypothetical protein
MAKRGCDDDGDDKRQGDLFLSAEGLARTGDPWTSHVATKYTDVSKLLKLVYEALLAHGPMTTHEIAQKLGKDDGSITPRPKQLEERGLVIRFDHKMGPRGRKMIVWKAVRRPA